MKKLFHKYKHGLWLLYVILYFPWFSYLEKTVTTNFHVIHMNIDDAIPFCEYFIIPYLLWFIYVVIGVAYFFFREAADFNRLCVFLGIGMTTFLIISTIYPNGQTLRPEVFPRDNLFTHLVAQLYESDTPTNLFPSIHAYNAIAINTALWKSKHTKKYPAIRIASAVLMILIVLATMFLKQHSAFDVITAIALAVGVYLIVYVWDIVSVFCRLFWKNKKTETAVKNEL